MSLPQIEKVPWPVLAALFFFLTGCGSSTQFYRAVEENIGAGRYPEAIQGIYANRGTYGDKSSVLYNLDLGLLYHYAGVIDSSSFYLLAAEREMEALYTRSVSLAAMSVLLNDNVLPYDGEDFEKVLVNVFLALNYAQQGFSDEALVEARKVDLKLRALVRQYEGKNKFQEDALARYLAGALYETGGEINDAFISYKKAYEGYDTYVRFYGTKAPPFLLNDLVRTAERMSFTEEAERYRQLGGSAARVGEGQQGSLIVVAYAGRAPIKTEVRPRVSIPDSAGIVHTFQMALPKFTPRFVGGRFYDVDLRASGDSSSALRGRTTLAEDITAIANLSLEDRLGLIYLKSGGRALLKFFAAEKAKEKLKEKTDSGLLNFLGSLAIDVAVGATEQADVRSWRTLPAQIQLARFELAPGRYIISVTASDGGFRIPHQSVAVDPGKVAFVIVDDVR